MPSRITKEDLRDTDIIDAIELASDGTTLYITGAIVISTTASTQRIIFSGIDLIHDVDEQAETKDLITLVGTSGADGTYTINNVIDSITVDVEEPIVNSTGGTANFMYPPGAIKVGLDPTGLTQTTATNVQDAIKDIDGAIAGGGITEAQHELLDTIVHDIDETSYDEFVYSGSDVASYTIWETAAKLKKVREELYTYSTGHRVSQVVTKQYDSVGALKMTMTEVYTYSGSKVASVARSKS